MPTGYTAKIKDGISFERFIMDCARAFGATIRVRDEPSGGEYIPAEFKASDYSLKGLQDAESELARIESMTDEQCARMEAKDYDERETRRVAYLAERRALREAYDAMLAKVDSWVPPTAEHETLKTFMREQIEESIRCDCGESYYEKPAERRSGQQWRADQIDALQRSVAVYRDMHAKETASVESANAWIKALRDSLNPQRAI